MSDMNNGEEKKRPNANYKLSYENTSPDEIVYHYNRERRLAKAPQIVLDLYKMEKSPPRFNLLKPLIRTKPLAMMFCTVIVICLLILVFSILGLTGNSHELEGNQLSIQARGYEGTVIIVLQKTIKKNFFGKFVSAYNGAVEIAVAPLLESPDTEMNMEDIFYHKIFFTLEQTEYYRFAVPFNAKELAMVFQTEKNTLKITVKTE